MQYRILTEDLNRDGIVKLVSAISDSFTIIETIGYWRSNQEKSIIIIVDLIRDSGMDFSNICDIAKAIKDLNKQECVLVQRIADIESRFI